jgi:trehalose synthase
MHGMSAYSSIAEPEEIRALSRLASQLKGRYFMHINSTSMGGGVAEILHRLVYLFRELGIHASWEVIKGDQPFFEVTKQIHNGLQGMPVHMTPRMWKIHKDMNAENAKDLSLDADLVFNHDPQPAPLVRYRKRGTWVWRCHIDVSHPHAAVWKRLLPDVLRHDAAIFSGAKFAQKLKIPQFIIAPAIDPLSEKNRELNELEIREVLEAYQIDTGKPILLQISRFDRFKDPVGVIRAYRMVKKSFNCQLILAGGTATDDPEGEAVLSQIREEAKGDPDIHVLLLPPFSHQVVNALQRTATIILQKSLREGFGLTVTEALWKGKPVIGGAVGGIPLQIQHGITGFLVHSVEGAAFRIRQLLHNPRLRERLGTAGKEHVRRNFLITRQAKDYLALWVAWNQSNRRPVYLKGK